MDKSAVWTLRKSWFRLVGTITGGIAIVVLTACFPQNRVNGRMPTQGYVGVYSATLAYLRAVRDAETVVGQQAIKKAPIRNKLFGSVIIRPDGRGGPRHVSVSGQNSADGEAA
jgi:hypothetical protein